MAKANKAPNPAAQAAIAEANAKAAEAQAARSESAETGSGEQTTEGKKELNPAIPTDAQLKKQEADAEKATKAKAKQDEKDAAAKVRAEKAEAKKKEVEAKKAERAQAKQEREARLAELGKNYKGSMLALADKVKSGEYVKGLNGQLRSNNPIAVLFDGISPTDVIRIGLDVLKLEDNPYAKLNVGQQSMNLRNRIRGAIKQEKLTVAEIEDYIARNGIHRTTVADVEAAAKARAEAKAKREQEAADKKAKAAEAKPAESAPANENEAQAAA